MDCQLTYHRKKFGKHNIIKLISGTKELAHIRYSEDDEKITIEFVFSHELRKGYGKKLVGVVQAVAVASNKPLQCEAVPKAVAFFKACGFVYCKRIAGLYIMRWRGC